MSQMVTFAPVLNFLDASYLGGWNPHPTSGSLIAPLWDNGPGGPCFRETIVRDGATARNAVESAASVLEDCRRFRASLNGEGYQLPQPLPARAAGWILNAFQDGNDQVGGTVNFEEAEQPKRLTLDLRNPRAASFELILQRGATELTQKISVDRERFMVTTDYYFLKTRMRNPAHAADCAAAIATLVYDSEQYDVEKELGSLKIRDTESGQERTFRRAKGRYTFRGKPPEVNELVLASALSVFEESEGYREPVMSITVGALKSEGPYPVSLLLYRPSNRPQRRMPLRSRLQKLLWETIGKRVEGET